MKLSPILCLVAALALTGLALHDRSIRANDRSLLRIGLDDAAQRLRAGEYSRRSLSELGEKSALAAARFVAELIRHDRSYLADPERLDALRLRLGVDQIRVLGSNAVVTASVPADFRSERCAVSERLDAPGVVQIGFAKGAFNLIRERLDSLSAVGLRRIGRDGWLEIEPSEGLPEPVTTVSSVIHAEERVYLLEDDCEGMRLRACIPLKGWVFADNRPFAFLLLIDTLLLLVLLSSRVPALRHRLHENWLALVLLFGRRNTSWRTPVLAGLVAALVAGLILYLDILYERSELARETSELLEQSAQDMLDELDGLPDSFLLRRAKAIVGEYHSPEELAAADPARVAARYGLDELSIVDSSRQIVATSLKSVPDRASRPEIAMISERILDRGEPDLPVPSRIVGGARRCFAMPFPKERGGYIVVGFDLRRVRTELAEELRSVAHDWDFGDGGFYLLVDDATGEILSSDRPEYPEGSRLDGEPADCRVAVRRAGGYRVLVAFPDTAIWRRLRRSLTLNAVLLVSLAVLVIVFLSRLSGLVASLRRYIAEDAERRRQDLALARTIQLSSLPVALADTARYSLYARMDPAREVGGDFYDAYTLPDGRVAVTVADVSGKGVPAALFTMRAKAQLKSAVLAAPGDLAAAVAETNRQLCLNNDGEMFVTAWVALIDSASGEAECVSAGHNPPLLKRADGSVEWLRPRPRPALGVFDDSDYLVERFRLAPGDSVFAYTDGVTEAQNAAGELFGNDRLEAALRESGPLFVSRLREVLAEFVGDAEQFDDITMLAFDLRREGGAR